MHKLLLAAAVAAATAMAAAAPALASSPGVLDRLPGSEVRRSTSQGDERREEVLTLHRDGRLTGNYQVTRTGLPRGSVEHRQGRIHGSWEVVGDKLCIAGRGLSEGDASCYHLSKARAGRRQFAATNLGTGEIWRMFVSFGARD